MQLQRQKQITGMFPHTAYIVAMFINSWSTLFLRTTSANLSYDVSERKIVAEQVGVVNKDLMT